MFEVQDLRYATLATVSRCGMVWFSEDVLTNQMIFSNFLLKLRSSPMEETEEDVKSMSNKTEDGQETVSPTLSVGCVLGTYTSFDIFRHVMGLYVIVDAV